MKKLLSLTLIVTTIAACGSKKATKKTTNTKVTKKASDYFISVGKEPILAYATQEGSLEMENPKSNLVARELYKSAFKYSFTLPGWPKNSIGEEASKVMGSEKLSNHNFYSIERVLGSGEAIKASQVAAKILSKWEEQKVNIGFIQTNPETKSEIINGEALFSAVEDKKYTGKLVLTGQNTKNVDLWNNRKGSEWSELKNVATFEFSEIITAYNTGYLTQSQFGKIKLQDGKVETRTVGYIVGSIKKDDKKSNVLNMKKANAFRKGVLDAVKEQKTGEPKFVDKKTASDKLFKQKLQFESSDISTRFKKLRWSENYKAQDRSITYFAGADAEENDLVAGALYSAPKGQKKYNLSGKRGHILVVEVGGYDSKDIPTGFGEGGNGQWVLGSGNSRVSTRVYMATKPWVKTPEITPTKTNKIPTKIYSKWAPTIKYANAQAVEAVLSSLYGENKGKVDYFGKHTYIGGFPGFVKPGTYRVNAFDHPIDDDLLSEVRILLYGKNIDIENIRDEFLGSGL